jgi:hypothetical protein
MSSAYKRLSEVIPGMTNDECSVQLFDVLYENKFKLAKKLTDDGMMDVNIKDDCGVSVAVCNTKY